MHCRKAQKYLLRKIEGSLAPGLRPALDEHLQRCARCREEWESVRKVVASLKRTPAREVPPQVWAAIVRETSQIPVASPLKQRFDLWRQRLFSVFEDLPWGRQVAFSGALAGILAVFVVWGAFDMKEHANLPVVQVAANPVSAFPSYFREHHNPAGQPISEGPMVLAFNTMRENP